VGEMRVKKGWKLGRGGGGAKGGGWNGCCCDGEAWRYCWFVEGEDIVRVRL